MRRWLFLLAGPLLWAAHFGIAYAIASISVAAAGETTLTARALIVIAGVGAAIAAMLVALIAARMHARDPLESFWRMVTLTGAIVGAVAIIWQTWPALAPI